VNTIQKSKLPRKPKYLKVGVIIVVIMVNDQLLTYIRQSLASGLKKPDIEKALLSAGWIAMDIRAGFESLDKPVAPPIVDDNDAETARILHEVEVEMKRHKWRGADASTPIVGGMIGWLIAKKLAHDEVQANLMLLGVSIIIIVLTVWLNWPSPKSGVIGEDLLKANIQEMNSRPLK
jgi:hypothetical protein